MDSEPLPANLVRLRHSRGQSQAELARVAGVSLGAYRNIEKGVSRPQPRTLRALAQALQVKVPELLANAPTLRRVRFRSLKRLKRRDQILVDTGRRLRDYGQLETLLGAQMLSVLDEIRADLRQTTGDRDACSVAALVRERFRLSEREPIHDICGLLEARGVKVLPIPVASDAFLGLSVAEEDGGPAVVVNTWERLAVEHWIFSAAHELGHLILHLGAYDVREQGEVDAEEREANAFASHFLMPESVFRDEWSDAAGLPLLDRVLKVKRTFRVSWRTVLYRVAEVLPQHERSSVWARFQYEHQSRYGRSLGKLEEPAGLAPLAFRDPRDPPRSSQEPSSLVPEDFLEDRLSLLVRQAVERGEITMTRAAEILGRDLRDMRQLAASWVA